MKEKIEVQSEKKEPLNPFECKHLNLDKAGKCADCNMVMPRFGTIFDHIGPKISSFIKVVYVDESRKD